MTLQADISVSRLEAYRETLNQSISQKSKKITVTALITKAVAKALQKNPILNSQFDGDKILLLDEINIGVATALDDGLIVPVVHHTDTKSISTISDEIRDLSERARSGKLQPDDLSNGTFTISNLGMFEIDRFTAIINPPQAAILAVGKKNRVFQPAEDNSFHVEDIITFTLSADHRVMDGAQAAKFMGDLKSILQNAEEL
jgi:pyruvate dehydrogenase E2 component (dihydrolipoamide acetyltransferase)